jgi:Na+/H+-translocating membrane pyrophosphatase
VNIPFECVKKPAKKTDEHAAAVIGDTVGDPLKDTSGPSLNILIKLSAIISLVFAQVFDLALLAPYLGEETYAICHKTK